MIKWLLIGMSVLLSGTAAQAQDAASADRLVSGNDLFSHCATPQSDLGYTVSAAYCVGFVTAVSDTLNTLRVAQGADAAICLPDSSNAGQLADIVTENLRANPGDRHLAATTLVMMSLIQNFPCG